MAHGPVRDLGSRGFLPVHLCCFCTAVEQPVEQLIKLFGDGHREPHLSACGTDLDWHVKHHGRSPVLLSKTCSPLGTPLSLVASFAACHRFLTVRSAFQRSLSGSYTVTIRSSSWISSTTTTTCSGRVQSMIRTSSLMP